MTMSAMKAATIISVFCAVISLVHCGPKGVSVEDLCNDEAKRQEYTDKVLDSLRQNLKANQPFKMEDDIRRVFRLYNGKIYNLHEFTLRHPPQVHCDHESDKANMVLLVAFNTTKIHYTWNVAGINGFSGGFWTFANRITTEIHLSAPLNQNKAVPFTADEVRVTELDGIWVRVDGIEPFAWLGSQIGNLGTMISRGTLKTFLQSNLQTIFNEVFKTHQV